MNSIHEHMESRLKKVMDACPSIKRVRMMPTTSTPFSYVMEIDSYITAFTTFHQNHKQVDGKQDARRLHKAFAEELIRVESMMKELQDFIGDVI
jgi:hypothetical protein